MNISIVFFMSELDKQYMGDCCLLGTYRLIIIGGKNGFH